MSSIEVCELFDSSIPPMMAPLFHLLAANSMQLNFNSQLLISSSASTSTTRASKEGNEEGDTMAASFDIDTWQAGGKTYNDESGIKDTPFEEYWSDLPSLRDATTTTLHVEGHSFQGRMAVLKYLMFDMDGDCSQNMWGMNREWHWLWGYLSQLDWQYRSGRLHVGGDMKSDADVISTNSWWNYMNFCFSICILLGAQRAGALDGVSDIHLDEASQELVNSDTAVQECIASWQRLFEHAYPAYKEAIKNLSISSREFGSIRFQLQQDVWSAHTKVIEHTIGQDSSNVAAMSPQAAKLLQFLPQLERDFGLGWCRMVEIIAACTFPTDLVSLVEKGAGFLPLQVVTQERMDEWEATPNINGPEARRYNSVVTTHKLLAASSESLHRMSSFWQRVVRTNDISRAMPSTIKQLANGTTRDKLQQLTRLFYLYSRPRGMIEWSIVVLVLSIVPAARALKSSKQ